LYCQNAIEEYIQAIGKQLYCSEVRTSENG
jgi:hypothetical protein